MDVSVSLAAIESNLNAIKKQIKGARLTLMVKADAYNHGVQRVAPRVKHLVDAFGVATAKEGAYLRLIGIENRILVTAYTEKEKRECEFYRLTPMLATLSAVRQYAKAGNEFDLKIDTGMCRLGLQTDCLDEVANLLKERGVAPRGIGSHLQYTDKRREDQLNSFFYAFEKLGFLDAKRHIANSHAALTAPQFLLDEVRVGIAAYGGLDGFGLIPALRATAVIEDVKVLKNGGQVGYDGLYRVAPGGKLAFVRSGYYDGVLRSLIGAKVLVSGRTATIAGNISMDSMSIDVTGLDVKVGDKVEYISEHNTAASLAAHAGSVPYEILTALKGRHTRRYDEQTGGALAHKTT